MPYIGQPLNAGNLSVQTGTGDGSDTTPIAALNYSVGSSESVAIYLDGVKQAVSTYTASGTTLTFTTAPPNGVGIEVVFLALSISLPTPGDATVTTAKIASGAVTSAKIVDNAVGLAQLASGTDGELITWDASGDPAVVAVGTSGQVLTSGGAGAAPSFATTAPGQLKGWVVFDSADDVIDDSYNVSSISNVGTGNTTVTWDVDFASVNYVIHVTVKAQMTGTYGTVAVGSCRVHAYNNSGANVNSLTSVTSYGDQ